MKLRTLVASLVLMTILPAAGAEDGKDGPRTGYFRIKTTPLELLGPEGTKVVAAVFEPDEKLEWQLYVPRTYDASKPAGVIVFINRWGNSGGSRKAYNSLLDEKNLIWAGVLKAGDKTPMNERMLRTMLAPTALARHYALDPARMFIGGFSGGTHVAAVLATGKPNVFKGGLFVGGALAWEKEKEPSGIELIRQNRYVFMAGSNDVALQKVQRTAQSYIDAGVTQSLVIVMPNQRQEMPGPYHLREAIEHLDENVN